MRHVLVLTLIAGAVLTVLSSACNSAEGENGQYCLKNDDCESKHCISDTCRPAEKFGAPASASTSSGGSSGDSQDAGTD